MKTQTRMSPDVRTRSVDHEFKRLGEGKLFVRSSGEEQQRIDAKGALVMSGVCAAIRFAL